MHLLIMMEHGIESADWETRIVVSDDGGRSWRYGQSLKKYVYFDATRYLTMEESGEGIAVEYYDGDVGGYEQAGYYLFRTADWGASWSRREYRESFDVTGYVDALEGRPAADAELPLLADAGLPGFGNCP